MLHLVLLTIALAAPSILAKPNSGDCFFFCNGSPKAGGYMQPIQQAPYYQPPAYGGAGMGNRGGRLESFEPVPAQRQPTMSRVEQMPATGEALFLHSVSSSSQSQTHGYFRYPIVGQMPVQVPSEPLVQYPVRPCAADYVSPC